MYPAYDTLHYLDYVKSAIAVVSTDKTEILYLNPEFQLLMNTSEGDFNTKDVLDFVSESEFLKSEIEIKGESAILFQQENKSYGESHLKTAVSKAFAEYNAEYVQFKKPRRTKLILNLLNRIKTIFDCKQVVLKTNFTLNNVFEVYYVNGNDEGFTNNPKDLRIDISIPDFSITDESNFTICFTGDKNSIKSVEKYSELLKKEVSFFAMLKKQYEFFEFNKYTSNNSPIPVLWINEIGEIQHVNKSLSKELGYNKSELYSINFNRLINEKFIDLFQEKIESTKTDKSQQFDIQLINKNQDLVNYICYLNCIGFDEHIFYSIFLIEVNQLRKIEDELFEKNEFLNKVINLTPNILFVKDKDGKYELVNDAFCAFHKKSKDQIIGNGPEAFSVYDHSIEEIKAQDEIVRSKKVSQSFYNQTGGIDENREKYFQTYKTPLFNKKGEAEKILCISNDITPLKRSETKLLNIQNKLTNLIGNLKTLHNIQSREFQSFEEMISAYLKAGCEVFDMEAGFILDLSDDNAVTILNAYSSEGNANFEIGQIIESYIAHQSIKLGKTVFTNIDDEDKGFKSTFESLNSFQSLMASPLSYRSQITGVICFFSSRSFKIDENDQRLEVIDLLSENISRIHAASKIELNRQKIEVELTKSESLYRAIVEDQDNLIVRFDINGNCSFANKAYMDLIGWESDTISGYNIYEDQNATPDAVKYVKDRLAKLTFESPVTNEDDITPIGDRIIAWNERAIYDNNGNFIEYQSVGKDITKVKLQTDFLQSIIDTNPNYILVKDVEGTIILANKATAELYGKNPEEMIGLNDYDISSKFLEKNEFYESDKQVIEEGRMIYFPEQSMRDPISGDTKYFQTIKAPVPSADGKSLNLLVIAVDITERKIISLAIEQSNNKLKLLADQLKKSNQELQQFAYAASHDLQEPLRMVASYLQLLENRYSETLDESAKEFIYFAVDGAKRMQVLINDLLDFSRVQSRKKPFVEFDFNDLLDEVKLNLRPKLEEKNVEFEVENLPTVFGERSQLMRLLQNLVDNAIKFNNSDLVKVKISASETESHYKICVEDNGIGIPDEYKKKVFEIFKRLHSSAEYSGTGIGLAICKRIADIHKGQLEVNDSTMGGAKFSFSIEKGLKDI